MIYNKYVSFIVAESVVGKKDHKMDNVKLTVGLHFDCLGILPPGHDRSTPQGSIPDDLFVKDIDLDIVHFMSKTKQNRDLLERELIGADAKIEWPQHLNLETGVTISCTLTASSATKAKKEAWPALAKAKLEHVAGFFVRESVNILQEGWDAWCRACNLVEMTDDSMMTRIDKDSCTVTVVGKRVQVDAFVDELKEVCGEK